MKRAELRALGDRLLDQSRALRAAFPDRTEMNRVTISDVGTGSGTDKGAICFCAALEHLRTEMVSVRDGKTHDLSLLGDESANVERNLLRM